MLVQTVILWLILILSIFLIGYALGRRKGIMEGINKGLSIAPLDMRKKSLELGVCQICEQKVE